jgi:SAM-dependent methyltransferase
MSRSAKKPEAPQDASAGLAQFSAASYWEDSYRSTSQYDAFEWYLPLASYKKLLVAVLPPIAGVDKRSRTSGGTGTASSARGSPRILNLGCGTSALPKELHGAGFAAVTSVDISASCIAKMRREYPAKTFPGLEWGVEDALALSFPDASFDVVLDKATSDVFMAEKDVPARDANVSRMFAEGWRVLRPGGLFIIITRYRPTKYSPFFAALGWRVTHTAIPAPRVYHGKVHVYTATKPAEADASAGAGARGSAGTAGDGPVGRSRASKGAAGSSAASAVARAGAPEAPAVGSKRSRRAADGAAAPADAAAAQADTPSGPGDASLRRLAGLGLRPLSIAELNAEDSGGSDDDTDSDDSSYGGSEDDEASDSGSAGADGSEEEGSDDDEEGSDGDDDEEGGEGDE